MSVIKREYLCCQYDIIPDLFVAEPWHTKPYALPDWFINAPPQYKKIVRILGATGNYMAPDSGEEPDELPRGVRLMGSLTKDFPLNNFIMMMNNYDCVKEFNITYNNIRELTWWLENGVHSPLPAPGVHMDLVVELELLMTTANYE
jgi:hypothetical protein